MIFSAANEDGFDKIPLRFLKDVDEQDLSDLAVVLQYVNDKILHVGLLVRDAGASEQFFFIHQPGHMRDLIDTYETLLKRKKKSIIIDCFSFLSEIERVALCMQIHAYANNNASGIPYAVNYFPYNVYFDSDGLFVEDVPGAGLTCATFILELMKNMSHDLIVADDWPVRSEDDGWRDFILGHLVKMLKGEDYAVQVANKTARYRPEEVAAAAALYKKQKLDFLTVSPVGSDLRSRFIAEMS